MNRLSLFLFTLLFLTQGSLSAQISLEKRYPRFASRTTLAPNVTKWYFFDQVGSTLKVYNDDHSLYKQVTIPALPGSTLSNVFMPTEMLFDSDPDLDYLATYYNSTSPVPYKAVVYNENGTSILSIDSCNYAWAMNTSTGTKLNAMVQVQIGAIYTTASKLYSLPGQMYFLAVSDPEDEAMRRTAFPNPTQNLISLPYKIPSATEGVLKIHDLSGRELQSFRIDNTYENLLLDTRNYASGTYIYSVFSDGRPVSTSKFIVAR